MLHCTFVVQPHTCLHKKISPVDVEGSVFIVKDDLHAFDVQAIGGDKSPTDKATERVGHSD